MEKHEKKHTNSVIEYFSITIFICLCSLSACFASHQLGFNLKVIDLASILGSWASFLGFIFIFYQLRKAKEENKETERHLSNLEDLLNKNLYYNKKKNNEKNK